MYALVQFVDDGIYHVTNANSIRSGCSNTIFAKYKYVRYAARLLCCLDRQEPLMQLKESLDSGGPWVYLSKLQVSSVLEREVSESEPETSSNFSEDGDDSIKDISYQPHDDVESEQSFEIDSHFPYDHDELDLNDNTILPDVAKDQENGQPVHEMKDFEEIGNTSRDILISNVPNSDDIKCKKYFCIFCKKLICKLARHLEVKHRDIKEVRELILLPKGCPERMQLLESIRKKGAFMHNSSLFNSGSLIVSRRPMKKYDRHPDYYKVCPSCKGFYSKATLRRHFIKCDTKSVPGDKSLSVKSRMVHGRIHSKAASVLRNKVFPKLRDDDVTKVVRYDELAILFGNKLTEKYRKPHLYKMIRSKLRLIGRFMLAMKNLNPLISDLASCLVPTHYNDIIKAVNNIAVYDPDIQKYKSPATAFEYGTLLKKCAKLLKNEYIKKEDEDGVKRTNNFLSILEEDYTSSINKTVEENQLERMRHKKIVLPSQDDIYKLHNYLENERKKYLNILTKRFHMNAWKQLAMCTLTSIQIFNRRRSGEMERITIEDFQAHESVKSKDLKMYKSLSIDDEKSARKYVRFMIRGKRGRSVPVLLHEELLKCIQIILSYRSEAGVSTKNVYVFGWPGSDDQKHLDSCTLLRKFSTECNAEIPSSLRGTELRKQFATSVPLLNDFKDTEVDDIANFMGHARKIHDEHYKIPIATRDIVRMSRLLEKGCEGCSRTEGEMQTSVFCNMEERENVFHINERYSAEMEIEQCTNESIDTPKQASKIQKKRSVSPMGNVKRSSWSDSESSLVLKTFQENVDNGTLPSSEVLAEFIQKSPILKNRNEIQLKSWISNQIRKRKSGSTQGIRKRKGPVMYWTTPEKNILRKVFSSHLKNKTLPSFDECDEVIEKNSILNLRSRETVKAWVNNQIKKLK